MSQSPSAAASRDRAGVGMAGEGREGAHRRRDSGADAPHEHGTCRDGGNGHEARGHSINGGEAQGYHPQSRDAVMRGADFGDAGRCVGAQGGGGGARGGCDGGGEASSMAPMGASSCGMALVAGGGGGAGRKRQRIFHADSDED
jgi:hypothetical protein